jgi:hypothetical protein
VSKVADLIALATTQLGKPYVYGDEGPNTFDCSGLMQYVFGLVGIKLPRTAAQQQKAATRVTSPVPGDLVFYGNPAHHVALYIGGGRQIAAPHTGATVAIQSVGSGATYGRVTGLGAGAADLVTTLVSNPVDSVTAAASSWLGPARNIVLEGIAVVAGLTLVTLGLWRAVGRKYVNTTVERAIG